MRVHGIKKIGTQQEKYMTTNVSFELTENQLMVLLILEDRQGMRFPKSEHYVMMIRHQCIQQYGRECTLKLVENYYNHLIELGLILEPRRYMPQGMLTAKGFNFLMGVKNTEQFKILEAQRKIGPYARFDPLNDCS